MKRAVCVLVVVAVVAAGSVGPSPADAGSHPAQQTTGSDAVAPSLGLGASGAAVTALQYVLRSYGYTVAVDGQFGPQTARVVRSWQKSNGLDVDGIVGPATMATLTPAVRVDPPAPPPVAAPRGRGGGPVEQIIRDVWPDDLEDRAVAIATRESRLIPTVRNACCFGLFQIHWTAHRGWLSTIGITSSAQLFDPETNARAALALFQRDGWSPWAL